MKTGERVEIAYLRGDDLYTMRGRLSYVGDDFIGITYEDQAGEKVSRHVNRDKIIWIDQLT